MNNEKLLEKYISLDKLEEAKEKLKKGYPIQYLIGNVEFVNSIIEVNESVLIPRFETEVLVDKTYNYVKNYFNNEKISVLDMCTGSGCIAISLKKMLNASITGIDISIDAIKLAKKNALNNNVDVLFEVFDINNNYNNKFDLIISNPPYIGELDYVDENVKKYEPNIALFAEDNGIYYYKKIISYLDSITNDKFMISFELGDNTYTYLKKYLEDINFSYKYIFEKDYNDFYRYLFIFSE